ncbi:MAG: type 4a pilus biogenesis protein PilO [Nitrospirae bacterium]|nr:type 4a pilus biogenesis protein PilO [Nitrospirota bacterium]
MRKSVVIAAISMALIAGYVFFIMPFVGKRAEIRESLEAKYAALRKYESFLKSAGKTGTGFETAIKEVKDMESGALQDTNESLAFAKLQGYIQDFAEMSGIRIVSIKPLSVVKYKYYSGLPIQIEAIGWVMQLSEFLKQVDSSKRFIRIDKLYISVVNIQSPWDLKIKMQISGLMRI